MSLALAESAPAFSLPGVDGRQHSLDDYGDAAVLVLIQSCNHCPYVQAWEGRMKVIQRDYAERGVRIVAIRSNDAANYPEDSFEAMARRAEEQGFNFDYPYDEDQSVARSLGSERTPEVFVFDSKRALVYHGAIDDNRDEGAVTRHYLREALDAVLAGRVPPVAETQPVGCSVKCAPTRADPLTAWVAAAAPTAPASTAAARGVWNSIRRSNRPPSFGFSAPARGREADQSFRHGDATSPSCCRSSRRPSCRRCLPPSSFPPSSSSLASLHPLTSARRLGASMPPPACALPGAAPGRRGTAPGWRRPRRSA